MPTYGTPGATSPEKQKFVANAAAQSYKGPSIVDYLSLNGGKTDLASRGALAGQYGIQNYTGSADQNTALLTALRGGGTSPTGTPTTPETPATGGTPPQNNPNGPGVPGAQAEDPYRAAFDTYLKSLEVSPEQKAANDYLNSLITQSKQANEKALNEGDTLGFAAGEADRVNRTNSMAIDAASRNLEAQTGYASSKSTIAKARADFEATMYKNKQDKNAPFELSPGQERYVYNEKTGAYEKTAAADPKLTLPASAQEYEYAKKNGYTGTFTQYQNEDANRKYRASGGGAPTSNDRANIAQAQADDVATAVIDFKEQMAARKWKGANPDAYNYYKQQLSKAYGASAVLELDKQMKEAGIKVDYGTK